MGAWIRVDLVSGHSRLVRHPNRGGVALCLLKKNSDAIRSVSFAQSDDYDYSFKDVSILGITNRLEA